jgi:hypothetical protein
MVGGKKMLSAMSAPQPTKRALAIKTEAANKELL